jgi:hypothetical protein
VFGLGVHDNYIILVVIDPSSPASEISQVDSVGFLQVHISWPALLVGTLLLSNGRDSLSFLVSGIVHVSDHHQSYCLFYGSNAVCQSSNGHFAYVACRVSYEIWKVDIILTLSTLGSWIFASLNLLDAFCHFSTLSATEYCALSYKGKRDVAGILAAFNHVNTNHLGLLQLLLEGMVYGSFKGQVF